MDYFDRLSKKIKERYKNYRQRLYLYFKRLVIPIYLLPFKLLTYSTYYLIKFSVKFIFSLIALVVECVVFPFKSLKNLLKSLVVAGVGIYLLFTLLVSLDYFRTHYGYIGKYFCTFGVKENLLRSVVRIVGGYSEGSGFFIAPNRVLTSFHVIADEPSPKIIFTDGTFTTAVKILGDKRNDLAVLYTQDAYPDLVIGLPESVELVDEEPLLATGYPMGTEISGKPTILGGNFIDYRKQNNMVVNYVQTSVSLVSGMSGGPLTDQCGKVVGINTLGVAGMSMFVDAVSARHILPSFTDQEIKKIEVDPSKSPDEAVRAFYTYLKARRMKDGFNLLSREYLKKTDFQEWTNRFTDIIDVDVMKSVMQGNSKDTVSVKFMTKNWRDNEVELHFYEGTWQTVFEDGVYKMLKSMILEVDQPQWDWFYD